MADFDILPVPEEIPWRLAATNQVLELGEPTDATISIFYYEPHLESLSRNYPDERLVYLKFTLTVIPPFIGEESLGRTGARFLSGVMPVRYLMFDAGVTPEPFETGGIRPYFQTAAPLRRTMVESGVLARAVAESENTSIAIGRSGSQLLDTVNSYTTTTGLEREDVHSLEEYSQVTNRDASQERRELTSHTTHVENILTLLAAKHVGSPFLGIFAYPPKRHIPEIMNLYYLDE